jgi:hypothetical protein
MINPLKVASAGYLKRQTKAVLIIAVAGYLNFSGTPIPPIPPSGGNISYYKDGAGDDLIEKQQKEKKKLEDQNNLIIAICKVYIECNL